MPYINNYQADVRVSVDDVVVGGAWATYAGGDLTAADAKTRAGGMGKEVSTGGQASRSDITLTTQWTDELLAQAKWLESRTGVGEVKVSVNWLNKDRTPKDGGLFGRTGTVKTVNEPDFDHQGNAVGMLQLVVSADEEGS